MPPNSLYINMAEQNDTSETLIIHGYNLLCLDIDNKMYLGVTLPHLPYIPYSVSFVIHLYHRCIDSYADRFIRFDQIAFDVDTEPVYPPVDG